MIEPYAFCTIPSYQNILRVHNKWELFKLAISLNIKVPLTIPLPEILISETNLRNLTYPAFLKPRQGGGNWQIYYVNSKEELLSVTQKMKELNLLDRILYQEYVPAGKKFSHAVVYNKGKRISFFTDLHIRDYPYTGGSGCCRVSVKEPAIEQIGQKLFDEIRWHGLAEIEIIKHQKTGEFYLIEVNPRIWGGINSAISSGLDVPYLLYKIAIEDFSDEIDSYKTGVETRWLWGELRSIQHYLANSPRTIKTLLHFLKGFIHLGCWDELDIRDPVPMIKLLKTFINQFLKKEQQTYESLEGEWT